MGLKMAVAFAGNSMASLEMLKRVISGVRHGHNQAQGARSLVLWEWERRDRVNLGRVKQLRQEYSDRRLLESVAQSGRCARGPSRLAPHGAANLHFTQDVAA